MSERNRARLVGRWLAAVAVVAGATIVSNGGSAVPVASAACNWCAGGEYHPIAPRRVFDSRTAAENPGSPINDVAPVGAKPLNGTKPTFDLQLLGIGQPAFVNAWLPADVTAADVLAVMVSVTVVNPSSEGYLAAYPTGSPALSSLVNFKKGQTVPNLGLVRPGADGKLTILLFGGGGTAHVLVDVFGWYSTSTYRGADHAESSDERGGRIVAVDPGRILDTRPAAVGQGQSIPLAIRGADTVSAPLVTDLVPNDPSITGVVLNITAAGPTANTYVSVVPDRPVGAPTTSNMNLVPGQVKANLVMVPIGADGNVWLYNNSGNTPLIADVVAYVQTRNDESRAGRVIPLSSPFRVFDTRDPSFGGSPLGPGAAEDWSFASFAASVMVDGVAVGNQSAFLGNLTNASLARQYGSVPVTPGYLTVYPTPSSSGAPPVVSNLNSVEGQAIPNMALVKYGPDYKARVFNFRGYAHYLVDVSAVILAD